LSLETAKVFQYVFVWHSYVDAHSCRKCVALNGREYRDQDLFAPVLVDPEFGPIWDLNQDRSLMHGGVGTCRCFLEVQVESFDLTQLENYDQVMNHIERMR
jgi:hypothetical protein